MVWSCVSTIFCLNSNEQVNFDYISCLFMERSHDSLLNVLCKSWSWQYWLYWSYSKEDKRSDIKGDENYSWWISRRKVMMDEEMQSDISGCWWVNLTRIVIHNRLSLNSRLIMRSDINLKNQWLWLPDIWDLTCALLGKLFLKRLSRLETIRGTCLCKAGDTERRQKLIWHWWDMQGHP